jgi:hypothetical protein
LLNRKENYTHYFKKLYKYLGEETERKAVQKASKVIKDFFDMVTMDMIKERCWFVFPVRQFGYMVIHNARPEDGETFPFFFQTEGDYPTVRLVNSHRITYNTRKTHKVQLSRRLRAILDDYVINKGYRY